MVAVDASSFPNHTYCLSPFQNSRTSTRSRALLPTRRTFFDTKPNGGILNDQQRPCQLTYCCLHSFVPLPRRLPCALLVFWQTAWVWWPTLPRTRRSSSSLVARCSSSSWTSTGSRTRLAANTCATGKTERERERALSCRTPSVEDLARACSRVLRTFAHRVAHLCFPHTHV